MAGYAKQGPNHWEGRGNKLSGPLPDNPYTGKTGGTVEQAQAPPQDERCAQGRSGEVRAGVRMSITEEQIRKAAEQIYTDTHDLRGEDVPERTKAIIALHIRSLFAAAGVKVTK